MTRNTNSVIITGHLGSDPEIRQFQNGGQIATFNLAIGDDYRDKQGNTVKRTHWIPIVVHGNSADVARQYLQNQHQKDGPFRLKSKNFVPILLSALGILMVKQIKSYFYQVRLLDTELQFHYHALIKNQNGRII